MASQQEQLRQIDNQLAALSGQMSVGGYGKQDRDRLQAQISDLRKRREEIASGAQEEKKAEQDASNRAQEAAFELRTDADVVAQQQETAAREQNEEIAQQQQAARTQQQQFISQLQQTAAGTGDTAAQKALREAAARESAQRQAIQASQAGTTAAGRRAAVRAGDTATAQLAQQSEQLRLQEQLQAQQQLANALQNQRQIDIGQQQLGASQAATLGGLGFQLDQASQAARAGEQQLAVERNLANVGARLTRDIGNMQAQAAQRRGFGAALGGIGGALLGGPIGGSIGASLGGLLFNKGGKVKDPKQKNVKIQAPKNMSKEEKFGFKKALQSNTEGSPNYSQGGSTDSSRVVSHSSDTDAPRPSDFESKAFEIEGLQDFINRTRSARSAAESQSAQAFENQRATRAKQADLASAIAAGSGQSDLASLALKAQSEKNLAQQLASAQGARNVPPAAVQQALMLANQQQAGQTAQQAAQIASQEQQQQQQLGLGVGQQLQATDLQQQQFLQDLANQQLAQQFQVAQAQQQARAGLLGMRVDEMAALKAAEAQRSAARAQAGGGGLISGALRSVGIKLNEGGTVPGKATKKGDHIENDTVPAMLSPGEIVIPRSVVDKGEKAMVGFIKGIQAMESDDKKPKKSGKMYKGGMAKKMKKGAKTNYADGGSVQNFLGAQGVDFSDPKRFMDNAAILGQDNDKTSAEVQTASDAKKAAPTKESSGITDQQMELGGAIAENILGALGAVERQKREIAGREVAEQRAEFNRALSRIRSRRGFSKGGKVSSTGYGSVLEAKRLYNIKD